MAAGLIEPLGMMFEHIVAKIVLGYFGYPQMIEYFRLKIEYLRYAIGGSI